MAAINSHSVSVTFLMIVLLSSNFVSIHGHFGGDTCNRTTYPKICRQILKDIIREVTSRSQMILFILLDGAERAGKYMDTFDTELNDDSQSSERRAAYGECKAIYENIKTYYTTAYENYTSDNESGAKEEVRKVEDKIGECRRELSNVNISDGEGPLQKKLAVITIDLLEMS